MSNKNSDEPAAGDLQYAWYVVCVLMLCYTFSFIDRQIMAFLVGSIKHDLQINDAQMGLLGGLAFAILFTLMGLPMGRLADTRSRRGLIAVGIVFWSAMTAACSVAKSFWSLFAARVGVGIGEATLAPAAFSLIADYFPKDKIARALSVYAMGILIGSGLASIVGGAVVQAVTKMPPVDVPLLGVMAPWRMAFLVVGLPGFVIALLLLTIKEPRRRTMMRDAAGAEMKVSVGEALAHIRQRWASVLGVAGGMACQSMCNYAVGFWAPAYFARVHGWSPAPSGMVLGLATIFAGCTGLFCGGWVCDRWQKRGLREAPLKVGVIGVLCAGIALVAAFSVNNAQLTVALLVPAFFFLGFPIGSTFASLQWIFPNQVRGFASAFAMLILNLGGMSLGSFLPGYFNNFLFHDEMKIGQSLVLTFVLASVAGVTLFRVTYGSYRRDHERLNG